MTFLNGNQRQTHVSQSHISIQAKWAFSQMTTTLGPQEKTERWVSEQLETWKGLIKQLECICTRPLCAAPLSVVWGSRSPRCLHTPQSHSKPVALNQGWVCPSPCHRGTSGMSGDIFGCHYWGATWTTSIVRPETRDAAQHPTTCRAGPTTENVLTLNVSTCQIWETPKWTQASKVQVFLFHRLYSKWPLEVRSGPHE